MRRAGAAHRRKSRPHCHLRPSRYVSGRDALSASMNRRRTARDHRSDEHSRCGLRVRASGVLRADLRPDEWLSAFAPAHSMPVPLPRLPVRRDRRQSTGDTRQEKMHSRSNYAAGARTARPAVAPLHRGPQAMSAGVNVHAPNAALLIDFDNVTLGIRSDLTKELRTLLNSPTSSRARSPSSAPTPTGAAIRSTSCRSSESSIDLIFAPAFGSSKKNATDIRLAIDAHRAGLHPARDRHLHPALRRLRLLVAWSSSSRSTASTSSASASASRRATC